MKRYFFSILLLATFVFNYTAVAQVSVKLTPAQRKIAEGVTASSPAARRKLRCCATLRNASTPSSAPCRTVKFCFMAHRDYSG